MKKMYQLYFTVAMISGTLITVSSSSWLGMWMGLEINLLSITPLLSSIKNQMESEATMKYFITQAMASAILIMAIIANMQKETILPMINSTIMNMAILTKMGAAPFHFWFPEVMEGLSWMNGLIMLTWQKIAPMIILMYSYKMIALISMAIVSSMLISGVMGINQTSLRKIMAYSSINHIGWMISSMIMIQSIWIIYLTIYSTITTAVTIIMKTMNTFHMNQLINAMNNKKPLKMLFIMNFLSMGGLPPFIGFFPKWITINFLVNSNFIVMSLMMIVMTLMTLYFYMRITFSALVMKTTEMNFKLLSLKNSPLTIYMNFIMLSSLALCTLFLNFI
uniref:NADH-ubiquinone oxidoreductase chain 2 n=1 Tax=Attagenus unicolor japonicus TaxID=1531404 RepID=A0A5H2VEJ9_9COLE|nr:NADH dehydrogenase subunit 2 [Attagenus unicolor japonicus]BBE24794.1 NADH dehydrogenase subunit 2 [Attagenus unicolor japonicus]